MIGIYKITNKYTGKSYIGQSIHCGQRLDQHYSGRSKQFIDEVIQIEGKDSFIFELLKEADEKELNYWEDYYIIKYNTKYPNGYNKKWNCSESLRESIKMKVLLDMELEERENNFETKQKIDLSETEIMYKFNCKMFHFYLSLYFMAIEKDNKLIIHNRLLKGRDFQKSFCNICYGTALKYLKDLEKSGIIKTGEQYTEIKPISLITDIISEQEFDVAKEDIIYLWFVKVEKLLSKRTIFFGIDFIWAFKNNSSGCYHSGNQVTIARLALNRLQEKGLLIFTDKTSTYKFSILLP